MQEKFNEQKIQIIEKLSKLKNITLEQAKQLFENLENYCELIINYSMKNKDEQKC